MRHTILLADDSPTIQRLIANTFADGAFDIVSVRDGDSAIRKFEEVRPSIVLADIYMPGRNGYEVCAYVRRHSDLGATPVVLLVGAFDAFDDEKAREVGATASITKPFEPQALIELVQSMMPAAPPAPDVAAEPGPEPPAATPPPPSPVSIPAGEGEVHSDLLGLEDLFKEEIPVTPPVAEVLTDEDIDRIADRVIRRMSSEVVESIAWEIVPDLTERIVREELKKINEG